MNKSTFFSGQPIFTQLLKFIPKDIVFRIACEGKSDRYWTAIVADYGQQSFII